MYGEQVERKPVPSVFLPNKVPQLKRVHNWRELVLSGKVLYTFSLLLSGYSSVLPQCIVIRVCFFKKMSKCVLITGNKEDPVKVANEMRSLRKSSGKLRFAPVEWRTSKQISGYFSRLAAAQRQKKAVGQLLVEAENIDENDLQAWYNEQELREIARVSIRASRFASSHHLWWPRHL